MLIASPPSAKITLSTKYLTVSAVFERFKSSAEARNCYLLLQLMRNANTHIHTYLARYILRHSQVYF